jgi:phage-related protein
MVKWKGIEFSTKGIIVEKTPSIMKGKKRFEKYEIEGRNGVLVIDKGTYDSFVVTLECHFDISRYSIEEIKEFLDGYGTLSFDGKKEYTAIIQNQIEFEKVSMFRKFPIQFLVNPICTDINSTLLEVESNNYEINIEEATANMYPLLTIKGSGDVSFTFNNKTFYLYELNQDNTYYLDCENKVIYDTNNVNCSRLMRYDFPYLKPKKNTISYTGTITLFQIEYKKAYI